MDAPATRAVTASRRTAMLVIGLVGAALAVVVTLFIGLTGWGQPGTASYATYELLNRLSVAPMLLMTAAPIALLGLPAIRDERRGTIAAAALLLGLCAMVLGTTLEFWLFSDAPYSGAGSEGRNAAYLLGTFLGGIVALVAMALIGSWGMRRGTLPRWTALTLIALPLALVILPFTPLSPYLSIPAGVALVAGSLLQGDR